MAVGDVTNDVLLGRDGELFLAMGGHNVIDYATRKRPADDRMVSVFRDNLLGRATYAAGHEIRYLHVICPDKQSVLIDKFITPDPFCLGEHYLRCLASCDLPVIYPLERLRAAEGRTFMKTDTHPSDYGTILTAILIAQTLLACELDREQSALLGTLRQQRDHVGDLGSKLNPAQSSREIFAQVAWKHSAFSNRLEGGNNGGINIIISPNAPFRKRLLWYGDSFGRSIVKFLSFLITETVFLRTPFFHVEFAEQFKPDLIVTQNVERYLASCISDQERPNFSMYPFFRNRSVSPDVMFAETFSALMSYGRPPYDRISRYFEAGPSEPTASVSAAISGFPATAHTARPNS